VLRDGVPDGPTATWYATGERESQGTWQQGRRAGAWSFWHADGSLDAARTGHYTAGVRGE
jgi:antitoxin component YwqK of YwqJK toxin-antitoxin module